MKLRFNGAAKEVGRSCIQVIGKESNILFDAGLKISPEGSEYPKEFDTTKVDCVFISHAHLDHIGALPLFNNNKLKCPVFGTAITRDFAKIILKDSFHISLIENENPSYSQENIYNIFDQYTTVNYNTPSAYKNIKYQYFDAGHIPGSAMILAEIEGKRILYTGDFNLQDTLLIEGSKILSKNLNVDHLICESTYGSRAHTPRKEEEERFLKKVQETLKRNGSVLIPSFAIGRTQEMLLLLSKLKIDVPIYIDGMGKQVSKLLSKSPKSLRDPDFYNKTLKEAKYVKSPNQRKKLIGEQCIIITTSGMLDGGPAIEYLKHLYFRKNSSILLVGYQAEHTNGRMLMDTNSVFLDGSKINIKSEVQKYDFSSHSGQEDLIRFINTINPKSLFMVHGEEEGMHELKAKIDSKIKTSIPGLGEEIELE